MGIFAFGISSYHIQGTTHTSIENHSTADLYYDATNQILGSVFPTTSIMLYYIFVVLKPYKQKATNSS